MNFPLGLSAFSLHFSPVMPIELLGVLAALGVALLIFKALFNKRLPLMRFITFAAFIFLLSGPSLYEEQRESVPAVVAVIVDESASTGFEQRTERTQDALAYLQDKLAEYKNLEMRIQSAPADGALAPRTDLFAVLEDLLSDVPESRRAGAIFITDGQIHDVPPPETLQDLYGPVHVLLNGGHNERDRRIVLIDAPAFGIVGQDITVKFKIEDSGMGREEYANVSLRLADGQVLRDTAPVGEEQSITLPVQHAGQNVFELNVDGLPDELTLRNNSVAIDFQGVRDRLRVLLVSGKPHAGGRTWRDLLKADPSVDLVHFTILREPEKIDATPQNEMSLIAFPFRELFELKLYDFDLIIFDRYRLNRILPDQYFQNIADYVEQGGAFLEASGPSYGSEDSIYYTALKQILPGAPTGEILNTRFIPAVSAYGQGHPVTRSLVWNSPELSQDQPWGAWMRQVGLQNIRGDVIMNGINETPLLVLNRVGEGRVAQIASDHIWLWSRGYDGGGPHAELLRRVVHWLMKEPELDEKALDVRVDGQTLIIRRAAFERQEDLVTMTTPGGQTHELILKPTQNGFLEAFYKAEDIGIYRFVTQDDQQRFAIVGDVDPPEFRNVLTSAEPMKPLMSKSGGGALWLLDTPQPALRLQQSGPFAGNGWIGLRDNHPFTVTGASERPLLPLWLSVCLVLALIIGTWFLEGRRL